MHLFFKWWNDTTAFTLILYLMWDVIAFYCCLVALYLTAFRWQMSPFVANYYGCCQASCFDALLLIKIIPSSLFLPVRDGDGYKDGDSWARLDIVPRQRSKDNVERCNVFVCTGGERFEYTLQSSNKESVCWKKPRMDSNRSRDKLRE